MESKELLKGCCDHHDIHTDDCPGCANADIKFCENRIIILNDKLEKAATLSKIRYLQQKLEGYQNVIGSHREFIIRFEVESDLRITIGGIDAFDGLHVMGILGDQDIKSICDQAVTAIIKKYGDKLLEDK